MRRQHDDDRQHNHAHPPRPGALKAHVAALQQIQAEARQRQERGDAPTEVDPSRRALAAGLLSALGALALAPGASAAAPAPSQGLSVALAGAGIPWVDSMTALRASTYAPRTPLILLQGFAAPADGGGGIFCWDATALAADNNGTIVRPNTVAPGLPGRWRRMYSGAINAKWFGAGLGAADDQPVLQALIHFVGSLTGGTIYLPAGLYRLSAPLTINSTNIRILGEGEYCTALAKAGIDSTVFILENANFCQLANLSLRMQSGSPSTGSAILFTKLSTGALIERISIESMWQGISCGGAVSTVELPREVVIRDVKMTGILHVGLKLYFALNWKISTCVIGMVFDDQWNGPGSNHYGVWLDSDSEGCIFDSIFVLGGEHCWRIANSINPAVRGPNEHRFYSCIGDNGTVSCFYISSLHRALFSSCWASIQKPTSDAAVVLDSLDIWGLVWDTSQIVNVEGHGIKVIAATSFTVTNSTFSEWGIVPGGWSGIYVYPSPNLTSPSSTTRSCATPTSCRPRARRWWSARASTTATSLPTTSATGRRRPWAGAPCRWPPSTLVPQALARCGRTTC